MATKNDSSVSRSCLPKMDFPCFDGSDVRVWLDQCESYFTLYSIPGYFRVTVVSLHLSGKALYGVDPSTGLLPALLHVDHSGASNVLQERQSFLTMMKTI
jgi:hypothetical protein